MIIDFLICFRIGKQLGSSWHNATCQLIINMPIVSKFFGIVIAFYWNDHTPPHFHAKYGGEEAVIDIRTGEIIKGSLSRRVLSLVEEWRQLHVDELTQDWNLARERKPLHYIEPLE